MKGLGNGSWHAAGNRLFFRTAGFLWCIGDKSQVFVGPKNCPAEARVKYFFHHFEGGTPKCRLNAREK